MAANSTPPDAAGQSPQRPVRWIDVLEIAGKLIGALAVLSVAIVANSFQARMTGFTLQSQREQAETQLRATMFTSLIGPFVGSEKGAQIGPDQEQLLAELLVLNFNEDFESKPLMERVDRRLAGLAEPRAGSSKGEVPSRESLRAIARRMADRQVSSIAKHWAEQDAGHGCETYWLTFQSAAEASSEGGNAVGCTQVQVFEQPFVLKSPDGNASLTLVATEPDWTNQTVKISVAAQSGQDRNPQHQDLFTYRFTLTWFDLPLTDNTVLQDRNRFAINLRGVREAAAQGNDPATMDLRVIWFPRGYFTPRERPLDSGLARLFESERRWWIF